MEEVINLELDIDAVDVEEPDHAPVRVKVGSVWGYTRHDGAPVVSRACSTLVDFREEVARLKGELDGALEGAEFHFGDGAESGSQPSGQTAPTELDAPSPIGIQLDESSCVRDLMTREVKTVSPNDRVRIADEVMVAGGFRHVVVVSEENEVLGVVSQHDIMFAGIAWAIGVGRNAHRKALESVPIKEIMSSHVVSVHPDEKLSVAATLLFERKIGCLPVMQGRELVGIVTEADFLALFKRG